MKEQKCAVCGRPIAIDERIAVKGDRVTCWRCHAAPLGVIDDTPEEPEFLEFERGGSLAGNKER